MDLFRSDAEQQSKVSNHKVVARQVLDFNPLPHDVLKAVHRRLTGVIIGIIRAIPIYQSQSRIYNEETELCLPDMSSSSSSTTIFLTAGRTAT